MRHLERILASLLLLASPSIAQDQTLTREQIERLERGVPPKSPEEALKTFEVAPGFSLKLVAHEPAVVNPVAGTFDENGLFYVAELIDYPYRPKEGEPALGRIVVLLDNDADGVYDESHVFAEDLLWAAGLAPWKGGLFVTAPPDVWYMKDTDGNHRADLRQKVYTGFGVGGAQYILNNLAWGLDHWIYASVAGNGGSVGRADDPNGPQIGLRERDLRFDPVGGAFEAISGGEQFGNSFDDWGNRFLCNESDALIHVVLPLRYLVRNPYAPPVDAKFTVTGGPTPIFRTSPVELWREIRSSRRLLAGERSGDSAGASHHVLDSVAGTTVYRGDAYPEAYRGSVFLTDAQNNLVHHRSREPNGVTFSSERVEKDTEFVRSSDTWFRPVNLVHAPDGTLLVLDLAREVLDAVHIPMDVVEHIDLTSGRDRGRIYQIRVEGFTTPPPVHFGAASTAELVGELNSPNGWRRDTAHRLIYERQDKSAAPLLRELLANADTPQARLHALWSLDGLAELTDRDVLRALADESPRVREHAVQLAESRMDTSSKLRDAVLRLSDDSDVRVRFQVAFTLGNATGPEALRGLVNLARRDGADPWMVAAILSAPPDRACEILIELLHGHEEQRDAAIQGLIEKLMLATASSGNYAHLRDAMAELPHLDAPLRASLVLRAAEGIARAGGEFAAFALSLPKPAQEFVFTLIADARRSLTDKQILDKMQAITLTGLDRSERSADALLAVITGPNAAKDKAAAVRVLAAFTQDGITEALLAQWPAAAPPLRNEIVSTLVTRKERAILLLGAVEQGAISPGQLTASVRTSLQASNDASIAARAKTLFAVQSSREEVIRAYAPALELTGKSAQGKVIFVELCGPCHQLNGEGNAVGPNLALLKRRTAEELLTSMLDPNRDVDPAYVAYDVVTNDGEDVSGVIVNDGPVSVTLRNQQGERTFMRDTVREIRGGSLSMMPEELETDLRPQDMADLLAYLRDSQYDLGTSGHSTTEK